MEKDVTNFLPCHRRMYLTHFCQCPGSFSWDKVSLNLSLDLVSVILKINIIGRYCTMCMRACTCVWRACVCVSESVSVHACVSVCACICCACACVCVFCECVYTYVYVCLYVCFYLCVRMCICMSVCVFPSAAICVVLVCATCIRVILLWNKMSQNLGFSFASCI